MAVNALILDANQRSALAATRSLGRGGATVIVADTTPQTLAGASKYAVAQAIYASPYEHPDQFFEDLLRLLRQFDINFLIPMTEASAYVVLAHRERLPASVKLPFPDQKSLETLANKNHLVALAQRLGFPVPHTQYFDRAADAQALLPTFTQFPLVLKPAKSRILTEDGIVSTHVVIARSQSDLEKALQRPDFGDHPFMIQSYVAGEGQGIFALYRDGTPLCFFAHRRLREKPPEGGVSVFSESRAVDPQMQRIAEKLLTSARWNGVAMVEFKRADDGTPYIMEVNPRFWGSLQLAVDAGVDFPYYLQQSTFDPSYRPPQTFVVGQRLRWLLGDLDRLYLVLKAPLRRYSLAEKLKAILQFCSPNRRTRHEVNRWSDMGPFWFELRTYVKSLF